MNNEIIPSLKEGRYYCPYCKTFCPQHHYNIFKRVIDIKPVVSTTNYKPIPKVVQGSKQIDASNIVTFRQGNDFEVTVCAECDGLSFWHGDSMVYPHISSLPDPLEDMPDEVKDLYLEASNVFPISAKSSSALLRLAIELLLENLGEKGNLNSKIKSLVNKGVSQKIQQGLDAVRWYGNNGVHPGEIDLEDKREDVVFLFYLLNIIVQELITDSKEADKFYKRLPKKFLEQITKRDKR